MTLQRCNRHCVQQDACHAWEYRQRIQTCLLFAGNRTHPLDAYQAPRNDPNYVVGFMQRRAGLLRQRRSAPRRNGDASRPPIARRVLYVLHFHHEVLPHGYARLLNDVLPRSWAAGPAMDLAVVAPRAVSLATASGAADVGRGSARGAGAASLVNPFRARSDASRRGANSYMSLPLARARFPGYGGYLLVNDDATLRLWDLPPATWFGARPWGTFRHSHYMQAQWGPRQMKNGYPYGKYGYSWYNYDSGSTGETRNATRSNFDAALDGMNKLCQEEAAIVRHMDRGLAEEFCDRRTGETLSPYFPWSTKADVMYVPGNELGALMMRALTVLGEHDVFLEFAYPMVMNVVVPREARLEMPLCDGSMNTLGKKWTPDELQFVPHFKPAAEEGQALDCPVIHPIKFGNVTAVAYWKEVLQKHCASCATEEGATESFWVLA